MNVDMNVIHFKVVELDLILISLETETETDCLENFLRRLLLVFSLRNLLVGRSLVGYSSARQVLQFFCCNLLGAGEVCG